MPAIIIDGNKIAQEIQLSILNTVNERKKKR
jgi:hypothetical protein